MKPFKKSFLVIFLFSLIFWHIFASNNSDSKQIRFQGTGLCNYIFSALEKTGFHPQVQPLVSSGTNDLPYNIIVSFHPQNTKTDGNLILFFDMEDCLDCLDFFNDVFNAISQKDYNCSVVFGYGNNINIPRENLIFGSKVYAQSLNTTASNAAFLFKLNSSKNSIITGSGKSHSPSWMLKDLFDAYSTAKITEGLPVYFISQTEEFSFSEDNTFTAFNEAEIPCILAQIKDKSKLPGIIQSCIQAYEKSQFEASDSHTFMFRFSGKRIWFSELRIITSMLVILILSLMLVFYIGFINKNLRKEFWKEISNNWYVIPVIFVLSVIGFLAGKFFYTSIVLKHDIEHTAFGFIIMQISISMLLVSAFFMLNLSLLKQYTTRSIDFILIVITFANQFILSIHDISLFPIFMLIFLVSVISFIFRRNWIHIILFVFLFVPFIPYVNAIFRTSDTQKLNQLLLQSSTQPFLMSLILLPGYLMWLRILNAMKKRYAKKWVYALVTFSTCIFLMLVLFILNKILYSGKKNNLQTSVISQSSRYDFDLSYNDKSIFSDTIRTVHINSQTLPVYASLKVETLNGENGVLYSENNFTIQEFNSAIFTLPIYPPSELDFSYGCTKDEQTLIAEEIFFDETDGIYYSRIKTITTGIQEGKQ